jgi:aspartyl-tRNA(Asn)/glutamyl-tRNA(Gln) amidotransferase subunit A
LISQLSLESIQNQLFEGSLTCIELVNTYLANIKAHADLNAFIEVLDEEALSRAADIDLKIKKQSAGPLAGLVVGIKDVLNYEGHHSQGSSLILEGYKAAYSATAVARLIEADAIIIGRQNCDEFGMGSANENTPFGPVKNGLNPELVPGGSSGGSAVAVQMGMCQVSLGSDTGGSVRQPAAFCGIVGLKPTYSRVSRHGLMAYASSFDTIGILSNNIDDNAQVLQVIAGKDNFDSTVSSKPVKQLPDQSTPTLPKRFCYWKETLAHEGLSSSVKSSFLEVIQELSNLGHVVEEVEFPLLDHVLPAYYLLTMAEASSNLSRYDGVRYGKRSDDSDDLLQLYIDTRTEGFGPEVQRRIMLGTFVLSAGYYDAYYEKAQKIRKLVRDKVLEQLGAYDFILSPTTPGLPFKIGAERENPVETYLEDLFTVTPSMAGVPAISVPLRRKSGNLPLGLQVIGNDFEENELYAIAEQIMSTGK